MIGASPIAPTEEGTETDLPETVTSPTRKRRHGCFLLVVGPDGSGKSTLARALVEATSSASPPTMHIHWRPGLLPRAGALVGVEVGDPTTPHARPPHSRLASLVLLIYNWLDFFLGTWFRILPARARGALIVMERGWMDIVVDQRRYRQAVPPRLVRGLARLLPSPDFVLLLHADPAVLSTRKPELPPTEIARQLAEWRRLRFPGRTRHFALDTARGADEALSAVLDIITR